MTSEALYLRRDTKLSLVTVNNRLTLEVEIVHHHDLSCHPIWCKT